MEITKELLKRMESDLGINSVYVKGQPKPVARCWHFSTDGKAVDAIFSSDGDFVHGMNRIFFVSRKYNAVVLAFALMDTHAHFILYGDKSECGRFVHEYVKITSMYMSRTRGVRHRLDGTPISCQAITDDVYLKTAICYVLRNPLVAGLPYMPCDYPWSSGTLYFRRKGTWTSPAWTRDEFTASNAVSRRAQMKTFHTGSIVPDGILLRGNMIFPGEYVAYEVVERLFRTYKSFHYFMGKTSEADIDSREGVISRLSMPLQELRQYRSELCLQLFKAKSIRCLDMPSRLKLARVLRSKYDCSVKQVCRVCGLVYSEVKTIIT